MTKQEELLQLTLFYNKNYFDLLNNIRIRSKNKSMDQEYYKYYTNIIEKSAKLLKELNLNDPVEISVLYEYLLWNGYFSKDNNLSYSLSGRKNSLGLVGADIMNGKSVCLNNADMLTNLLQECDIEAYTVGCTVPAGKDANFQYNPDIERNIKEPSYRDKISSKINNILHLDILGNHAVTCFKNGETYSASDPTSLAFLNFSELKKMKYVGSDLELDLKLWVMIVLNDFENYDELLKIIATIYLRSDLEPLKLNNIKNISESVLEMCRNNKNLLNDFHSDIYDDINGVCKTLTK